MMRTPENLSWHDRSKLGDPNNLTDAGWGLMKPFGKINVLGVIFFCLFFFLDPILSYADEDFLPLREGIYNWLPNAVPIEDEEEPPEDYHVGAALSRALAIINLGQNKYYFQMETGYNGPIAAGIMEYKNSRFLYSEEKGNCLISMIQHKDKLHFTRTGQCRFGDREEIYQMSEIELKENKDLLDSDLFEIERNENDSYLKSIKEQNLFQSISSAARK